MGLEQFLEIFVHRIANTGALCTFDIANSIPNSHNSW